MNLIVFEGPDSTGKTTLLNEVLELYKDKVKLLAFPKSVKQPVVKDGRIKTEVVPFKIISDNDMAIFETMLEYLDDRYVYLLDRSYISNYVYESVFANFRSDGLLHSYWKLEKKHNVLLIPLMRDPIDGGYQDDLINVSNRQDNFTIFLYNIAYSSIKTENPILAKHPTGLRLLTKKNKPIIENRQFVLNVIDDFIKRANKP